MIYEINLMSNYLQKYSVKILNHKIYALVQCLFCNMVHTGRNNNWTKITTEMWHHHFPKVFLSKRNFHKNNHTINNLLSLWTWNNETHPSNVSENKPKSYKPTNTKWVVQNHKNNKFQPSFPTFFHTNLSLKIFG